MTTIRAEFSVLSDRAFRATAALGLLLLSRL